MEGFHQLEFSCEQIPDLVSELETMGYSITRASDTWLGPKYPAFSDLIVERGDERSVFAFRPSSNGSDFNQLVYVNISSSSQTRSIRSALENRGAEWGYFDG